MIKAGIIGSTGYAGAELVRLLLAHPQAEIVWYGSRSYIDQEYASVYGNMFRLVDAACMDDDMNTADALGAVFELVKDANVTIVQGASREAAKAALKSLEDICDVLGILSKKEEEIPEEIADLVQQRAEARKNKDWAKSDELRDRIIRAGYILEDTKQGQKVRKNV